jgi:hypothetical protein
VSEVTAPPQITLFGVRFVCVVSIPVVHFVYPGEFLQSLEQLSDDKDFGLSL